MQKHEALFHSKLASSGLFPDDAKHLGFSVVKDASKLDPHFYPIAAIRLPYLDLDRKESGFFRLRYLEDLPGFAGQAAKPQRYAQSADTLNWAYLPWVEGIDWLAISADATQQIIITEGELKAACAAQQGWATVGLGGVEVWQSSKKGVPLLPPLDKFNWKGRYVIIVFDSDAASNQNVARAQLRLADGLLKLGAIPKIATLPTGSSGEKQGLDDFIVAGGDLGALLQDTHSTQLGQALVLLNERFAYVQDQDLVVELSSARRIKRDSLINGLMANNKVVEFAVNSQGRSVRKELVVPKEWLSWPSRRDVSCMTYSPGQEQMTARGEYNLWRGLGVQPVKGDIAPWAELLDYLFEGQPEDRAWFERWCAYPLQHLGTKLYTAVVVWGAVKGTGKSLVGYTLGRIYGTNFTEIGNSELHMQFNEWAVGKQLIMGEEITGSDRRGEADKLKSLITQHMLRINMKHLPTYEVPDHINYYFNSNHPDAFFIDDQERRYFIHKVQSTKPLAAEFYQRYDKWLKTGNGPEALLHYLLHLDTKGFNPAAPAPVTRSKLEMVDHSRSDVASFVANLLSNLDMELPRLAQLYMLKDPPTLVLSKHLRSLYDPDGSSRVTANGLGRELSRVGIKTLQPTLTKTFGKQRFYILADTERWLKATPDEVREYIDELWKGKKL